MNFKEILPIILAVLKDWRVIATAVAVLLVMEFAKYIANYKKKPMRPKKVKVKSAPAPKPKTPAEGEGGEESAAEE